MNFSMKMFYADCLNNRLLTIQLLQKYQKQSPSDVKPTKNQENLFDSFRATEKQLQNLCVLSGTNS